MRGDEEKGRERVYVCAFVGREGSVRRALLI